MLFVIDFDDPLNLFFLLFQSFESLNKSDLF